MAGNIDNAAHLQTTQGIAAVVVNACHLHAAHVAAQFVKKTGHLHTFHFLFGEIGEPGDFKPAVAQRSSSQDIKRPVVDHFGAQGMVGTNYRQKRDLISPVQRVRYIQGVPFFEGSLEKTFGAGSHYLQVLLQRSRALRWRRIYL